MDDVVKKDETTVDVKPFEESPPPSREERAATAIADLEHAMKHNAPIAIATLRELRDLLGVAEKVAEAEAAQGEEAAADK